MTCRILFMPDVSGSTHQKLLWCMEMPFAVIIVIKEVKDWDADSWQLQYFRIYVKLLQQWNIRDTTVEWYLVRVNYMRVVSCFLGATEKFLQQEPSKRRWAVSIVYRCSAVTGTVPWVFWGESVTLAETLRRICTPRLRRIFPHFIPVFHLQALGLVWKKDILYL